jgi:hypothetical protein
MSAQIMRHILLDRARRRVAAKRGGNAQRVNLDELPDLRACDFLDLSCSCISNQLYCKLPDKAVILRGCDFLDLSCSFISNQLYFNATEKAVILSEALRRSIANRGLYGAESKDPGDACWQMLLGAFWPQTTPEDKKVTDPERSASQIYRMTQRLVARSRAARPERRTGQRADCS